MNVALLSKLNRALDKFIKKNPVVASVKKQILADIQKDTVLPRLGLKNNTEIVVEHGVDKTVCVNIGPRDWQWDLNSGKLIGSGCFIG